MKTQELSTIFMALSQEIRLEIYKLLVKNSLEGLQPTEISKKLNIPKSTLSFHLSLLKNAGLCTKTKKGKSYFYKPNCAKIKATMDFLHKDCVSCQNK